MELGGVGHSRPLEFDAIVRLLSSLFDDPVLCMLPPSDGASLGWVFCMTNVTAAFVALITAGCVVLLFTPRIARLAIRLGAIDHPDGRRKNQARPVPRGGGVVVALAAFIAVPIALHFSASSDASTSVWLTRGLLPSVAILLVVGIIDDVLTLTGIYKLIGQVLAVSVLVATGAQFDKISLFGHLFPLGEFRVPFTIFFCLGAINAFNLIDGVDALAPSLGAIACTTLGIISATQGHIAGSIVCFALAGALLGFLRYNITPAKVYLGDTGSMLIGLVVAAVAIDSSIKQQAACVLAVPLAICAIPILDAAAALVRRITTGQSVFTPDRGHLHHALLLRGWSVNKTVLIIAGLTALTCGGALISIFTSNDFAALAIAIGVFLVLAFTRIFGHVETALVASRSMSLARRLISQGVRRSGPEVESSVQLQGRREWQNLWIALREVMPRYNVAGLTLQISIPHLHESFFADWTCKYTKVSGDVWRVTIPLSLDDRPIGKLSLIGSSAGRQALTDMQQSLDFLETLHGEIARIASGEGQTLKVAWLTPALN
jgi:UDP-GlcNAc:undecaprenyl-phosphate GlcNAc-1-phosphate transferase